MSITVSGQRVEDAAEALVCAMASAKDHNGLKILWSVNPRKAMALIMAALNAALESPDIVVIDGGLDNERMGYKGTISGFPPLKRGAGT